MKTMRAAVSRAGQPYPLIEAVELEDPRAGEMLVRIVAAGVCHTDLRAHRGGVLPTPLPVVLGHEGAGIVEQVGAAVSGFQAGDAVVIGRDLAASGGVGVGVTHGAELPDHDLLLIEAVPTLTEHGGARAVQPDQ